MKKQTDYRVDDVYLSPYDRWVLQSHFNKDTTKPSSAKDKLKNGGQ